MSAGNVTLLAFAAERRAAAAFGGRHDRYFLPAEPTAANPPNNNDYFHDQQLNAPPTIDSSCEFCLTNIIFLISAPSLCTSL